MTLFFFLALLLPKPGGWRVEAPKARLEAVKPIFKEHASVIHGATNGLKREEKELLIELVKRLGK